MLRALALVVAVCALLWLAKPLLLGLGSSISSSSSSSSCRSRSLPAFRSPSASAWRRSAIWRSATRISDLGAGRAARCRHVALHPAVDPAVRVPRPADRDDRHGGRDGPLPRQPARPCPRRPALRAGRRDVSRLRHLGLEGRRHGGDRAGAVSRDGKARRRPRRARRPAGRDRRADRNRSAEPDPHRARLGHRHFDRGAVHGRPAARRWCSGSRSARWSGGARATRSDISPLPERASRREIGRALLIALPALAAAVRHPQLGDRGRRDRDRSLDHRHRLLARSSALLVYRQFDWSRSAAC